MTKRYYTKIRKEFSDSMKFHVQCKDNNVYMSNSVMLVVMPDWLYREQFVDATDKNWTEYFPCVTECDRLTVENWEFKEEGPDLEQMWRSITVDRDRWKPDFILVTGTDQTAKYEGKKVRFCELKDESRVMLNNKYYEAMEQATRGGIMYGAGRLHPVLFYDCREIYMSAFCGCVMPINYNPNNVVAA